ncbi:flagellar hook-associated protein FlgK [Paenibacillus zanthoxyli]|uniref:flagellar hook-associated protein FlgK n=1 Tax=Paenibacillus zanthoxyli TaxID=369399 RepID=UPI0004704C7F|nr:flagellar hook-associated protein FlgK [Paenibacillus zanthoxyli]
MTSTFHGIETSKRSLFTQTAALNTTGHNIANANTEGYTRQSVKMQASRPMEALAFLRSTAAGQLGTGVEFNSIERVRQSFLDDQYRNENTSLGSWSVRYSTLDKLETIMNEPTDSGIRKVFDNFWNSWSDLSQDPENITNRTVVKETTLALTDAINQVSAQLDALSSDLTSSIALKATEINSYLNTVADLNNNISRLEGLGDNPNDLRDQRDLAIDKLSKLANVQVVQLDSGYQVTLGGQVVVTGTQVTQVSSETLQSAYQGGSLTGGEVFGMILSQNQYVADYRRQIDNLAVTLATGDVEVTLPAGTVLPEGTVLDINGVNVTFNNANNNRTLSSDTKVTVKGINGLLQLGYTVSGATPQTGIPLFTSRDGGSLSGRNITLNPEIASDPNKIASSMRVLKVGTSSESVLVGNSDLALAVAGLKTANFQFSSGLTAPGTVDDYFSSIIGQLGVQTAEAKRQSENGQLLTEQVEMSRQSVSGVSLDEEMSNLIKFQHAYSAASRFMTTIDQMLDKLINGTGRVGL